MLSLTSTMLVGSRDYRIDTVDVGSALGTEPGKICYPLLVRDTEPTPKDYASICLNCDKHGDFGSDIHRFTMSLRDDFKALKCIDFSHAPATRSRGARKSITSKGKQGVGKDKRQRDF